MAMELAPHDPQGRVAQARAHGLSSPAPRLSACHWRRGQAAPCRARPRSQTRLQVALSSKRASAIASMRRASPCPRPFLSGRPPEGSACSPINAVGTVMNRQRKSASVEGRCGIGAVGVARPPCPFRCEAVPARVSHQPGPRSGTRSPEHRAACARCRKGCGDAIGGGAQVARGGSARLTGREMPAKSLLSRSISMVTPKS